MKTHGTCPGCGCTDSRACTEGCSWVKGSTFCSVCVERGVDQAAAAKALRSARRFIAEQFAVLLDSVATKLPDGKPDMSNIDPYAVQDVRSFQRIIKKIDGALS